MSRGKKILEMVMPEKDKISDSVEKTGEWAYPECSRYSISGESTSVVSPSQSDASTYEGFFNWSSDRSKDFGSDHSEYIPDESCSSSSEDSDFKNKNEWVEKKDLKLRQELCQKRKFEFNNKKRVLTSMENIEHTSPSKINEDSLSLIISQQPNCFYSSINERDLENIPSHMFSDNILPVSKNNSKVLCTGSTKNNFLTASVSNIAMDNIINKNYDKCENVDSAGVSSLADTSIEKCSSQNSLLADSTPDSSLEQGSTKKSNKRRWVKVKRVPDMCYFCETEVLNFARHITRNHSSEAEVQRITSLPTKNITRKRLIATLRKRGNHMKNIDTCFKPVKKTHIEGRSSLDCIPCKYCLGYYKPRQLWRHVKICSENKGHMTDFSHVTDSQNLLVSHLPIDRELRETVFPRMIADKISLEVKKDLLICKFGSRYLKNHREKHLINVCSRKMRELAKLLMVVKKLNSSIKNMYDALQPIYFDLFVQATKIVAKFDPTREIFESPTYAMNIQTSLKQCCDIAVLFVLKRKQCNSTVLTACTESNLKTFKQLLTDSWKFEISTKAASDLSTKKWNKVTILPLATDLKVFRTYLLLKADEALNILKTDEKNKNAYKLLMETIFCRLLLLNRKRVGEMQRLPVHVYENANVHNSCEEFNDAITPTEKILLTKFKRVVIRGKRGRGVPVLFSTDLQNHIKVLLDLRKQFVDNSNIYLFPKLNTKNPITGYQIMKKHTRLSNLKNPDAVTSTRLRKHLATLTQILNMTSNDIEQLATFMGHTNNVHRQVYRLPDDIYQTAKISKLLVLMEQGKAGEFKGKALDEIEINLEDEIITNESGEDSDNETNQEYTEQNQVTQIFPSAENISKLPDKKRRTLILWTEDQKQLTRKFFETHIYSKKAPKKAECEELKSRHPEIFSNKAWAHIKVFVQNIYSKK